MFGGFGAAAAGQRFKQAKEAAKSAPERDVTEAEFVKAVVAAGGSADEAGKQARICRILGGRTLVGGEMLTVVGDVRNAE